MPTSLGVISDSHGDVARTRRAIELLQAQGAGEFVHCGDVCSDAVIDLFAGLNAHLTWGNCDEPRSCTRYARSLGIDVQHPLGEIEVDGKRVLFLHGDDDRLRVKALAMGADFLLRGHSHELGDVAHGPTREINPGAFERTKHNPRTVALLVPATGELRFVRVD